MGIDNESSELYPLNAMGDAGVRIAAINLSQRWIAFDNGVWLPITRMRDRFGYKTRDIDEVTNIEFGNPSFGYGAVEVSAQSTETNN